MLIAPDIPIPGFGAEASGPPMGAIGLVIWGILSPKHLTRIQQPDVLALPLSWALFGIYSLIITVFPWNPATPISIAYALQNLFYFLVGFLLLSGYCVQAFVHQQLHTGMKILSTIGLINAIAVIISVVTGPFYRHQVIFTARQWSGQFIQQGVGFSDSANGAGSLMMFFTTLYFFRMSETKSVKHWLLLIVYLIALLTTLSRSAIYSFFLSLLLFVCLRLTATHGIDRRFFIFIFGFAFLALFVLAVVLVLFPDAVPVISAAQEGLISFGDDGIVSADREERLGLWQQGMDNWMSGSLLQQLFGKGFRASLVLDSDAWKTPHNLYVAMLGDFGLIGVFVFLLPIALMLVALAIRVMSVKQPSVESFAFVSIVGLLINNTTETYLYSPAQISLMLLILIIAALELQYSTVRSKIMKF